MFDRSERRGPAVKASWRRAPKIVLSSLAEHGIDDEHARDFSDAMAPNPEWPDLDEAPAVSEETWRAARNAIDGLALRQRALAPAAEWLEPIEDAVAGLGVNMKAVEVARLVQYGAASTSGYFVFARSAGDGVRFTLSWSPSLMSSPGM